MASNPNNIDHLKFVYEHVQIATKPQILKERGLKQVSDLQNLAREYTAFLLKANKPNYGIA